jgi:hypothetical protein
MAVKNFYVSADRASRANGFYLLLFFRSARFRRFRSNAGTDSAETGRSGQTDYGQNRFGYATLTVTDLYGRYVSGLSKNAFTIFDNNQEQEITFFSDADAPVSIGILFDVSGSMSGEKIAKRARRSNDLSTRVIRRTNIF